MSTEGTTSFATKYRPIKLKEMVGQKIAKTQLAGMLKSGKLPKALLITGPTSAGKTTIARIFARHVNKTELVNAQNDIFEYNIGTNGTVEDIREMVASMKYLPRDPNHKKIFILDEAHRLTKTSASALLKEIEEPPSYVIFILCTNEPENLLETIRNRCEKITLEAYTSQDILELLKRVCKNENLNIDDEILGKIALKTNNSPRDSLATLQSLANIMAGGGQLAKESLDNIIANALQDNVFENAKKFLIALYIKKYRACVRRLDLSTDADGLLNICSSINISIIKWFASIDGDAEEKKKNPYSPNISSYHMNTINLLLKHLQQQNIPPTEALIRASQVQQLLLKCLREARIGVNILASCYANVGEFCFGNYNQMMQKLDLDVKN